MKSHQRLHSGEKPFVCTYMECQRAFARSAHLKRHMKLHLGIKSFICYHCEPNAAFQYKKDLARHQLVCIGVKLVLSPVLDPGMRADPDSRGCTHSAMSGNKSRASSPSIRRSTKATPRAAAAPLAATSLLSLDEAEAPPVLSVGRHLAGASGTGSKLVTTSRSKPLTRAAKKKSQISAVGADDGHSKEEASPPQTPSIRTRKSRNAILAEHRIAHRAPQPLMLNTLHSTPSSIASAASTSTYSTIASASSTCIGQTPQSADTSMEVARSPDQGVWTSVAQRSGHDAETEQIRKRHRLALTSSDVETAVCQADDITHRASGQ